MDAPDPVSRATAPHYLWGGGSEGWRLVDRDDLSVIEERVPAGGAEQWHIHARARQYFHVLSGAAEMHTEHGPVPLPSGSGVEIPPGTAHRFVNAGPEEVRFLVVSAPSARGDRTEVEAPRG